MSDFIFYSIIASVVLTLALNLLPRLFPNASRRTMDKVQEKLEEQDSRAENGERPRVQVFFPWKAMLLISIILTVFLNLGSLLR